MTETVMEPREECPHCKRKECKTYINAQGTMIWIDENCAAARAQQTGQWLLSLAKGDKVSEVSFEKKLEIAAKAFYRDCKNDENYDLKNWQEQMEEMRPPNTSIDFIESCYKLNKDDPELNTELTAN